MSRGGRPQQLPLELAHGEARTRDDLVVTPANERAVTLVENWPDWPAPLLILAGPHGSGKSHMAEIWCSRSGAFRASADAIGAEVLAAAEHRPVLIDDADAARRDETGLFYLINVIRAANTHLLMTARSFPAVWGVQLPDLLSRLKAATMVEINEPDDMLLAGVIVKLFADRQVAIEPHVVRFLTRRIERSLSSVRDMVEKLDRLALERKSRITRALAAQVVGEADLSLDEPLHQRT